jgi:hypothetical protein
MKKLAVLVVLFAFIEIYPQNIENTLGTTGNFIIKDATNTFLTLKQSTGFLGIGTGITSPRAQLEVGGYNGILSTGTFGSGTALSLGAGVRMHWYPKKGAFRAGYAESSYWDDANIGNYSIAMGYYPRATAQHSVVLGFYNKATGDYALSLGSYSYASALHSIAIGTQVFASGIYSIALGTGADTNNKDGSVVIGDNTFFQTAYASQDNQMTMRFSGGYRLWTSYPDSTSGVYMRHGQSGWSNYCNRNLKENFEQIDGEMILNKIKSIPITKWNYKADENKEKYIGPMAQDFYAAFQLNGTDSLGINSISIDGINLIGVQALEKRTAAIQNTIDMLVKRNELLMSENEYLKEQLIEFKNVKEELGEVKKLKLEIIEKLELIKNFTNSKEKEKIDVAVSNK